MKTMKVRLFQLNGTKSELTEKLLFRSLSDFRTAAGFTGSNIPDEIAALYDEVFCGDVPCDTLEDIFGYFNEDGRPNGPYSRSMSVSDIVSVWCEAAGEDRMYYTDNFGFKPVTLNCDRAGIVHFTKEVYCSAYYRESHVRDAQYCPGPDADTEDAFNDDAWCDVGSPRLFIRGFLSDGSELAEAIMRDRIARAEDCSPEAIGFEYCED